MLTSKQRAYLRGIANSIDTILMVGKGSITDQVVKQAEDALRSAAYTYVVAALSSLATLVYYIMIFMGRRD